MPDETPESLYDEAGSTPSQRELDRAEEGDNLAGQLRFQGQLQEAARQVKNKVARGGSKVVGREILGTIDSLAQGYDAEAAAQLGTDLDTFIHSGAAAVSQSQPAAPAPTAAKKTATINKARQDYIAGKIDETQARALGVPEVGG